MQISKVYSLSFVDCVLLCEEDAVHEDGGHDEIVEELIGGKVDGSPAQWVPRGEQEQGFGRREPVHVILTESFGHHAERLQQQKINR